MQKEGEGRDKIKINEEVKVKEENLRTIIQRIEELKKKMEKQGTKFQRKRRQAVAATLTGK